MGKCRRKIVENYERIIKVVYLQHIETTKPDINTENKLTIIPLLFLKQSQFFSIIVSPYILRVRLLFDPYD